VVGGRCPLYNVVRGNESLLLIGYVGFPLPEGPELQEICQCVSPSSSLRITRPAISGG
jgi:hypothetical protein